MKNTLSIIKNQWDTFTKNAYVISCDNKYASKVLNCDTTYHTDFYTFVNSSHFNCLFNVLLPKLLNGDIIYTNGVYYPKDDLRYFICIAIPKIFSVNVDNSSGLVNWYDENNECILSAFEEDITGSVSSKGINKYDEFKLLNSFTPAMQKYSDDLEDLFG